MKKKVLKVIKIIVIFLVICIVIVLGAHAIGRAYYNRTPDGGINKSMYVDINGTKQWINIYGQDVDNPVLLYLHGGPGGNTSELDYAFTRKWSDVFTVVTWDQRNCGKSYDASQKDIVLTKELLMEDGKEMTEYIRDYMGVEKIAILGHSWGSLYGANLVQTYPEYYNLFIGTGQVVDVAENEVALKEKGMEWAEGDEEGMAIVERMGFDSEDSIEARNELLDKYGYGTLKDGTDYNFYTTILFNPNYSIIDWIKYFMRDIDSYISFIGSSGLQDFSLKGKTEYQVPYININGDMDYQANYELAQEYYDQVQAPAKQMYIMEHTTHGLMVSKSEEFSALVHEIFEKYKEYLK